jgi:hypothetical protein
MSATRMVSLAPANARFWDDDQGRFSAMRCHSMRSR